MPEAPAQPAAETLDARVEDLLKQVETSTGEIARAFDDTPSAEEAALREMIGAATASLSLPPPAPPPPTEPATEPVSASAAETDALVTPDPEAAATAPPPADALDEAVGAAIADAVQAAEIPESPAATSAASAASNAVALSNSTKSVEPAPQPTAKAADAPTPPSQGEVQVPGTGVLPSASPAPEPTPTASAPAAQESAESMPADPAAAIANLDAKLAAKAVAAADDEFAEPAPAAAKPATPATDQQPVAAAAATAVAAAPVTQPAAPAKAPAPASVPASAAPVPSPVAAPAPAPRAPATPIVERKPSAIILGIERVLTPAALRLGAMSDGTRQTVGWMGVVTLFWAVIVWVGALAFMGPPKLPAVEGAVNLHVPGQKGAERHVQDPPAAKAASDHGHAAAPTPKAAHADASHGGH